MKGYILGLLLSFFLPLFLCAQDCFNCLYPQKNPHNFGFQDSYTYFKAGIGTPSFGKGPASVPSFGIGYRYLVRNQILDMSASFTGFEKKGFYYSFPRIGFYWRLPGCRGVYMGPGFSFSGVVKNGDKFHGAFADFTIGLQRKGRPLMPCSKGYTFMELNISQGIMPIQKRGRAPGPAVSISLGIGF